MAFGLTSQIFLGNYVLNGLHEVRIKKSIHGLAESATIALPSVATMRKGSLNEDGSITMNAGGGVQTGQTRNFFKDGDSVTINLGYNGELLTEFRGFVKQRSLGMPLQVECEGFVRQLRLQTSVTKTYANTTLKQMLTDATAGTDINVKCAVDFNISGVRLNNANGLQLCDWLRNATDRALTICFIGDGSTLYAGLPYTLLAQGDEDFGFGRVAYRLGYNLKRDNGLRMKIPSEPVDVIMQGRYATQAAVMVEAKDKYAKTKVQSMLNHIPDNPTLQDLATEKQTFLNYTGLEGNLTGFLQPYCAPGWTVQLVDRLNPDANGVYIVESTEVVFGMGGARRMVELGPKINYQ